jgi:DNA-binding XRE family transcriptional regulator
MTQKVKPLAELAQKIIKKLGLTEDELRSGGRQRLISKARRMFCQAAVKEMHYSGAEVARFLGVTTSAVNRLAHAKEVD